MDTPTLYIEGELLQMVTDTRPAETAWPCLSCAGLASVYSDSLERLRALFYWQEVSVIIFESDYWRPQIDSLMRHRQPSGMKRAERTYRRAFGRHRAVQLEIRECAMEPSAIGLVGGVESWPLGCMPDDVRREFYSVYARRRNGEVVALFDSKSLEECRKVAWKLERL